MAKNETLVKIIEWLYVNDNNFKNKNEWRAEFIKMLKNLLLDNRDSYAMGVISPSIGLGQRSLPESSCICNKSNNVYCPIHKIRL
jgi:hypothetical protein